MKTTDYEKFKIKDSNRPIREGLVKRLMESISEIGYVESRPIIVNENYEILDGQHRFYACQRLELPICFDIINANGSSDKIVIHLNQNQDVWRVSEFIHFYAQKGVKCYVDYLSFKNLYKLDTTNAIRMFFHEHYGIHKEIREGKDIRINSKHEAIASFIKELKPYHDFVDKATFVRSVVRLFNSATDQQIQKLFDLRMMLFEQPNISTYLKLFEEIINRRSRNNKIDLSK